MLSTTRASTSRSRGDKGIEITDLFSAFILFLLDKGTGEATLLSPVQRLTDSCSFFSRRQ